MTPEAAGPVGVISVDWGQASYTLKFCIEGRPCIKASAIAPEMTDTRQSAKSADFRNPGVLEVTVETEEELDSVLEDAIAVVSRAAREHKTGILITRIANKRYVVRAHPAVPFGLVRRQCP